MVKKVKNINNNIDFLNYLLYNKYTNKDRVFYQGGLTPN